MLNNKRKRDKRRKEMRDVRRDKTNKTRDEKRLEGMRRDDTRRHIGGDNMKGVTFYMTNMH